MPYLHLNTDHTYRCADGSYAQVAAVAAAEPVPEHPVPHPMITTVVDSEERSITDIKKLHGNTSSVPRVYALKFQDSSAPSVRFYYSPFTL